VVTIWLDVFAADGQVCDAPMWWWCLHGRALPARGQQGADDHENGLQAVTDPEPARQPQLAALQPP